MAPSISIATLEEDPQQIEEDQDYNEINNLEGW